VQLVQKLAHTKELHSAYVPRNPTQGKVFQVVQKHWKKFELEASSNDQPLSQYVKREFEAFLGCGILSKGFIRLVCNTCKQNKFVPFSCMKRGFCSRYYALKCHPKDP
jgi:hypothetical protein